MTQRTHVAMTTEESSPGVPSWGPNAVTTILPEGQTEIAIENLIPARRYYVKAWTEDEFGNKSTELNTIVNTPTPTREFPLNFSANGVFDSGSPMYAYVKVPSIALGISEVKVTLSLRQFFAPAQDAAASGTLTSDSGGGSTSGASSASSSSSDLTGMTFTKTNASVNSGTSGSASAGTAHTHGPGSFQTEALILDESGTGNHSHSIPHTHSTPNHQHTVPTHTHALTYGTFEETFPTSHSVTVDVYFRSGGSWSLVATHSGLTDDLIDLDLTGEINKPGDWQLRIYSAGGQPNGGRLGCDVFGSLTLTA